MSLSQIYEGWKNHLLPEEKKKAFIEDSALHAERGSVLVIGIKFEKTTVILEGEEGKILQEFWRIYSESVNWLVIGHCVKTFDIPFLIRRSWLNLLPVPAGVIEGRYLSKRIIDTMETWACGTRDMISLDTLSKAFGLSGKNGNGKDFASLYAKDKEAALSYLRNDLELTEAIANKMGLI